MDRPNDVLGAVLLRNFGPFIPVWLFGVTFAVWLDYQNLGGAHLAPGGWPIFVPVYSMFVLAFVIVGFLRAYAHAPERIEIGVESVDGRPPRRWARASPDGARISFRDVFAVHDGGLFGPRVEARRPAGGFDWMVLTPENARAVRAAWDAYRAHAAGLVE